MEEKNGDRASRGLMWTFAERISAQLVSTLVTIILARLLEPSHYGIISIVTVFISLCNVFVASGFGSAVVQKKEASEKTFNTAFILSITIGIIMYSIIFTTSPLVAKFYNMKQLTAIMRVMGIRIPLAALNSIQQAYIRREMKFKKFFLSTLIGTIISAFIGLWMAYAGLGVWALVVQYLTNTFIDSIVLLIVGGWRPRLQFSKQDAKYIFSFGWKVLVTDLIFTLENDIRSLIIGKQFGSSDLAYYDQGKKYPALLVSNINASIDKVMLPEYSRNQDDIKKLKQMLRKSIRMGVFILSPILIGFAVVSNNFVKLILTEKWMPCVQYIYIFCIVYITRPLESSCHQALLAIGKSDIVLRIMLTINIFSLITVIIAVFIFNSVFMIAVFSLFTSIVSLLCFMIMISRYIGYSLKEQLKDIVPTFIASIIMGICVICVNCFNINIVSTLITQIIVGIIVYIIVSQLLKIQVFIEFKAKISGKLKIRRKTIL